MGKEAAESRFSLLIDFVRGVCESVQRCSWLNSCVDSNLGRNWVVNATPFDLTVNHSTSLPG